VQSLQIIKRFYVIARFETFSTLKNKTATMCSNYKMKKHADAHVVQLRKASVTRSANFEKQRTSHYFLWNININK